MRNKVILACKDCKARNYTTEKNKHNDINRIEIKKFCKTCNEHTPHQETK